MKGQSYLKLTYGEIYEFGNGLKGVYLGNNVQGKGRILYRVKNEPVILSFNLRETTLESKVLRGRFFNISLNYKEKSFALEILNKKSL
jgi:hypothetical protein